MRIVCVLKSAGQATVSVVVRPNVRVPSAKSATAWTVCAPSERDGRRSTAPFWPATTAPSTIQQ